MAKAVVSGSSLSRFGLWPAWCVACLVCLPALWVEPFSDDFMRHLVLEGRVPGLSPDPFSLYDFTRGQSVAPLVVHGYVPWSTHPELSIRFFRPLSSLSVALDHMLFGRAQLPGVLTSIAWFLGMFSVVVLLFKRLLPRAPALLAALLYALAGGHAINLAWVSSRHLLIGATFSLLALYFHVCARESRSPPAHPWQRWAAPLALVLGMLASESFLGGAVFIVSYEVFDRRGPWAARVRAASPTVALSVAYLLFYWLAGYGPRHSGLYLSPFAQPSSFLRGLLERLPVLLGELAGALPSALWGAVPEARGVLPWVGIAFVALIAALLFTAPFSGTERRRLRFLAAAAVLACLPLAGGVLNGRMLVVPMLASQALIAWGVHRQWLHPRPRRVRWLVRCGAGTLAALHLLLAPLVQIGTSKAMADLAVAQRRLAESFDARACRRGDVALLLTGSDPSLSLAGSASLAYYRPELIARVPAMYVLSLAPHDLRVRRSDPAHLLLEMTDLPRRSNDFETLFNDEPFEVGDEASFGEFDAAVQSVQRGLPTRVRFRMPGQSCLLLLDGGQLVSVRPPAPGKQLNVRYEPGPLGL